MTDQERMPAPGTIAVDLTPLLPGGENGGAKIFIIQLLRALAREVAPDCRFVLLTRAVSHAELASLDGPNLTRVQVLDAPSQAVPSPRLVQPVASRLLRYLPHRLRTVASAIGYRWLRGNRRAGRHGLLRGLGAELLFCPFTAPTYAEAGVPVVSTVYDLQYRSYPQFFSPQDVLHRDAVFRAACRDSARIAAISDYTRESAISTAGLEMERIRTIHLRLADRFGAASPADIDIPRRMHLQPGRYLVYPANFWKHKNHEMLLVAFGMAVHASLPEDICLVCTGAPGDRCEYLVTAAARMGLAARVHFPGFLADADLGALLRASAGVVFPSLYEGFGMPVLEAMRCGVPVACSKTTSLPEVAAGAAVLFDPRVAAQIADAIIVLCCDTSRRAQLVAAGALRADEFADTTRMAREYWDLFVEAYQRGRSRSTLEGVFADGWIGMDARIDVVAPHGRARLELELNAPHWLPDARIRVEALSVRGYRARRFSLRRGERKTLSLPVHDGLLHLHIGPGFVPAERDGGVDPRQLTLMLERARIRHPDGKVEQLWDGAR